MVAQPKERIAFLTTQPERVPPGWITALEQVVIPPFRYAAAEEIPAAERADVIYVFPDCYANTQPLAPDMRRDFPNARWVAVLQQPDVDAVRTAIERGFHDVIDLATPPAVTLGPVLALRQLRESTETAQRLLQESLSAYDELRQLERVRETLRTLDLADLEPRIVREFADALAANSGALWRPDEDPATAGAFQRAIAVGMAGDPATLSIHALPRSADLLAGKPIIAQLGETTSVWIPLSDAGVLMAIVEIRRPDGADLLHREEARVRMLVDWTSIALRNALETERMRHVLRSRYGEFFARDAFRQHVDKALLQASRYRRPLTLVGVHVEAEESLRKRTYQHILGLLRDADIFEEPQAGRAKIFLPETGYLGGVQFLRRITRELAQKQPRGAAARLTGAVAAYPHHGGDSATLFAHVDHELDRVCAAGHRLRPLREGPVRRFAKAFAELAGRETGDDPNAWADYAFHLVQEAGMIDPEATRLLLFLGAYKDSVKTFAPLFEFPARWDRILVAAALGELAPLPELHLIRAIRDEQLTRTYFALIDRPVGAAAVWMEFRDGAWHGGILRDPAAVSAAFNRFEDQFMLHHKWVAT